MAKLIAYLQLMRLHKPVGIFLLLWPTLWALWIANYGVPPFKLLVIFILGVIIMRSAGCIVNDMADRNLDKYVERTRLRPLAAGRVSMTEALVLLFFLSLGALICVLQLNALSFQLSIVALVLTALYPFMKRITHFPQVVLGLAFAMPVLLSYAASVNHLPAACGWLFLIALVWPLMYDTAYALADYEEDLKIGIKSTATFFNQKSLWFIGSLQGILIVLWLALPYFVPLGVSYTLAVWVCMLLFLYQQKLLKEGQPFKAFLNNQWAGFVIFLGIALSNLA